MDVVKRGKWKSRWSRENIHLLYLIWSAVVRGVIDACWLTMEMDNENKYLTPRGQLAAGTWTRMKVIPESNQHRIDEGSLQHASVGQRLLDR